MKICTLIIFCGFLVVEHQATNELDQLDMNIIIPGESNTDQIAIDIDAKDFSKTSANEEAQVEDYPEISDNEATPFQSKTEDLVQDYVPDQYRTIWSQSPSDYGNVPEEYRTSPSDQVLQDLHNLLTQAEDITPSQNETNTSQDEEEPSKPKYPCVPILASTSNDTSNDTINVTRVAEARIVNATELLELVTSKADVTGQDNGTNTTEGHCVFVMFYAPWCKFSTTSAPHFNAIGRAFADIEVIAVDAFQFRSLNARYGTVSVPTFLFFFNSKPVLRYNYTERTFDNFVEFLQNNTGLVANNSVNVTDIDYDGPVPSIQSDEPDYALWFSGIFLLCWCLWILKVQYGTVISTKIDGVVNYMRHIWRTGEFYEQVGMLDHEHVD